MPSLEALKRKTQSAEDLQSVVRTMKTLAAVSIRQYEAAVDSLQDYVDTLEAGFRMVLWHAPTRQVTPLGREDGCTGAIVFGSDQGLCGQFNEQILAYAEDSVAHNHNLARFLAVGIRVANGLKDRGRTVDAEFQVPGSAAGIAPLVLELLQYVDQWRTDQHLNRILLFYNRRRSASSFRPHEMQLLPIPESLRRRDERKWSGRSLPTFTLSQSRLFSALVRQYLFTAIFRASAESLAGENASRIASMQSAERNINDLILDLRTQYHQQRQTSITEELLEVITGFEVLQSQQHTTAQKDLHE